MEKLLLNIDSLDFEIVGCGYETVRKGFNIKYKCRSCGVCNKSLLIKGKVCILRCKICSKLLYISPICSNKPESLIVGYNILSDSQYRKIRKQYKEVERSENLSSYINDYIKNKGK